MVRQDYADVKWLNQRPDPAKVASRMSPITNANAPHKRGVWMKHGASEDALQLKVYFSDCKYVATASFCWLVRPWAIISITAP